MAASGYEKIGDFVSSTVPRDFWLSWEQMACGAIKRAAEVSQSFMAGHQASVRGHLRHFALNEVHVKSLDECGIPHPPVRGNGIMVGTIVGTKIARAHMGTSKWNNSARSKKKLELVQRNALAKRLVQGDLFQRETSITELAIFIVTEGDGANGSVPIFVVVTDDTLDFKNTLFREPLSLFLQRYQQPQDVIDRVEVKLKVGVRRQDKQQSGDEIEPKT
ncbi:hypothetical protein [Xanthomonas sp. NCPPB 1128]|uniref:hypothetical protein n=1 Tax=Xanthomonas sp. NCPPB 1128 TaxID=1775876 RepID=UPI000B116596|nr:hypothetical protein [Xanthomonas sp. NCPPB 1128]